jgi:hypothetical protein
MLFTQYRMRWGASEILSLCFQKINPLSPNIRSTVLREFVQWHIILVRCSTTRGNTKFTRSFTLHSYWTHNISYNWRHIRQFVICTEIAPDVYLSIFSVISGLRPRCVASCVSFYSGLLGLSNWMKTFFLPSLSLNIIYIFLKSLLYSKLGVSLPWKHVPKHIFKGVMIM